MTYEITLRSPFGRTQLRHHVGKLADSAPFMVTRFAPAATNSWVIRFSPRRDGMAVGFRKFAELQLHLAQCGEILELRRIDHAANH